MQTGMNVYMSKYWAVMDKKNDHSMEVIDEQLMDLSKD